MKLTDAERLILINQYEILTNQEPENRSHYRNMIDELKEGSYENGRHNFDPRLGETLPKERQDFADDVMEVYEESGKPFYGFQDERLHAYAIFRESYPISKKGTPLPDEKYRPMVEAYKLKWKLRREKLDAEPMTRDQHV